MPDKEGDDEKKSTKSVVNKRQKQMMGEQQQKKIIPSGQGLTNYSKVPKVTGLGGGGGGTDSIMAPGTSKSLKKRIGDVAKVLTFPFHKRRVDPTEKFASEEFIPEEGYDIARDMGRVRPSKDKKDATTLPVSKEMRKTQKINKGPSALELVKKKYGKAVMKVGKKKANEELDLTQVAEAFGGYIIEANGKKNGKKNEMTPDPWDDIDQTKIPDDIKKDIEQDSGTDPRFKKSSEGRFSQTGETVKEPVTGTPKAKSFKAKANSVKFTKRKGEPILKSYIDPTKKDPKFAKKSPPKKPTPDEVKDARKSAQSFKKDLGSEKITDADFKDELDVKSKKPRPARKATPDELKGYQKEIEDRKVKDQVEPSPKPTMGKDGVYRNRPLPVGGSQLRDYFNKSPKGQAIKKGIDADTGKKFDMTNPQDYDKFMKVTGSSKRAKDSAKFRTQSPDSTITRTGGMTKTGSQTGADFAKKENGITRVGVPQKGGSLISNTPVAKAIARADKFVQKNPVVGGGLGLAGYDIGKGIFSKIMNLRSPLTVTGGRVGRRSAGGN